MKPNSTVSPADQASANSPTDGRLIGILSIAASPGAVLVSPAVFSLIGFFLALMGLTIAAPNQRILSIIGIVSAFACGGIGYFFDTPVV